MSQNRQDTQPGRREPERDTESDVTFLFDPKGREEYADVMKKRFWSRVHKTEGCWYWKGGFFLNGYGEFYHEGKNLYAHRTAYEIAKGPIPEGLTIDHLCSNRACVKPSHLEAVTNRENILRGVGFAAVHARKTHCPKGHPYSGWNLYIDPDGQRRCRTCADILRWERRHHVVK